MNAVLGLTDMHTEQNQVAFASWTEDAIIKHSLLNSFIACSLMCTLQIRYSLFVGLFKPVVPKKGKSQSSWVQKCFESWIGSFDYSFRKYLLRFGKLLHLQ